MAQPAVPQPFINDGSWPWGPSHIVPPTPIHTRQLTSLPIPMSLISESPQPPLTTGDPDAARQPEMITLPDIIPPQAADHPNHSAEVASRGASEHDVAAKALMRLHTGPQPNSKRLRTKEDDAEEVARQAKRTRRRYTRKTTSAPSSLASSTLSLHHSISSTSRAVAISRHAGHIPLPTISLLPLSLPPPPIRRSARVPSRTGRPTDSTSIVAASPGSLGVPLGCGVSDGWETWSAMGSGLSSSSSSASSSTSYSSSPYLDDWNQFVPTAADRHHATMFDENMVQSWVNSQISTP